jgi:hypothetical protein
MFEQGGLLQAGVRNREKTLLGGQGRRRQKDPERDADILPVTMRRVDTGLDDEREHGQK